MIRVYLVRHGIAAEPSAGTPDDSRPLTAMGRRRFRRASRAFARRNEPLTHLFTSPLVRAVQTAEILARSLRRDEVGILEELRSGAPAEAVVSALSKRAKDGEAIALVGHDPQMTRLVALLAQLDAGDAARVQFRKGAILRIDVDALPPKKSEPRWHQKPRSRAFAQGLPLAKKPTAAPPSTARR
ncbi:MAG TPA: phosphohistidine phosphatase SixA [Myxococcales bacterium]|jgi:phosphohistidine phosphatase|nr:phosphohistidine phosphatase SixA [Myxococcales bacterium]